MNLGIEREMLLTMKNKEIQMHVPSDETPHHRLNLAEGTEAEAHQASGFNCQFAAEAMGETC